MTASVSSNSGYDSICCMDRPEPVILVSYPGGDDEYAKAFIFSTASTTPTQLTAAPVKVVAAPSCSLVRSRCSPAGTVIPDSVNAVHDLTAAAILV